MPKRGYYHAINILRRDDFVCQKCHAEFGLDELVVHHINENPLNNDKDNLTTLCRRCHALVHVRTSGRRNIELEATIVDLRAMGMTFGEIAERLGCTTQWVNYVYNRKVNEN